MKPTPFLDKLTPSYLHNRRIIEAGYRAGLGLMMAPEFWPEGMRTNGTISAELLAEMREAMEVEWV